MTVKEILSPVITKQFEKYERDGHKIKLKTVTKKRIKYSVICGLIALLGFAHPVFFISILVYIFLMRKTRNNVDIIISLAEQNPNKPIDQIIAEEIKL